MGTQAAVKIKAQQLFFSYFLDRLEDACITGNIVTIEHLREADFASCRMCRYSPICNDVYLQIVEQFQNMFFCAIWEFWIPHDLHYKMSSKTDKAENQ